MNQIRLKKSEVIAFFGGTQKDVAEVVGIKQASVSEWPDLLSDAVSDRVRGAATRAGYELPSSWVSQSQNNEQSA